MSTKLESLKDYPKSIGQDRWGKYYDFTGNESQETCFWCGAITRRRYCYQTICRQNYVKRFHWIDARAQCLRNARVGGRFWHNPVVQCQDCSIVGYQKGGISHEYSLYYTKYRERLIEQEGITYFGGFDIHHITPLRSENRNWHWLNQWLICLCRPCHNKRHIELNYLQRRFATNWRRCHGNDAQLNFGFLLVNKDC